MQNYFVLKGYLYPFPGRVMFLTTFLLFANMIVAQHSLAPFSKNLWIKNLSDTTIAKSSKPTEKELEGSLNFNSAVNFRDKGITQKIENVVENESSVFLVYKINSLDEANLLNIKKGPFLAEITSNKIESENKVKLNKGNPQTGVILSYVFSKNSLIGKKKGQIVFDSSVYNDSENVNQVMEFIYVPAYMSSYERNLTESYLSVKYGISLNGASDYYDSDGRKTWVYEDNALNNFRVTGIGRDDYYNLLQKQSQNSECDGLSIGVGHIETMNFRNNSNLKNKTFLFWGDNNGATSYQNGENISSQKIIKRVWKTQISSSKDSDSLVTQIIMNKKLIGQENNKISNKVNDNTNNNKTNEYTWLAVDHSGGDKFNFAAATYIKGIDIDSEKISFNDVTWKGNSGSLFTITKSKDFFVAYDVTAPNCALQTKGKVVVQVVGGQAPYKITVESANSKKEFKSEKDTFIIEDIESGEYEMKVSDLQNVAVDIFTVDATNETFVKLDPEYFLNDGVVTVIVPKNTSLSEDLKYEWRFENTIIGTDAALEVRNIGDYSLAVTGINGCTKQLDFKVKKSTETIAGKWSVFPNPVNAGENFSMVFKLEELTDVSVDIHNVTGKIVKSFRPGIIKDIDLVGTLNVAGTYLITVTQNGKSQAIKLIVK